MMIVMMTIWWTYGNFSRMDNGGIWCSDAISIETQLRFQVKRWRLLMIMWLCLIMFDYEYDYVIMFGWHSTRHLAPFRSCEFARMRVPNKRGRDAEVTLIVIELSLEQGRTENDRTYYDLSWYNGQDAGFKQERARLRNEFYFHWSAFRWRKRLIITEENGFAEKKGLSKRRYHKTKIWYKRGSDTISGSSDLVFMSSPLRGQRYFLCSKMKPNLKKVSLATN